MALSLRLVLLALAFPAYSIASSDAVRVLETTSEGAIVFELGNITYLTNGEHPKATLNYPPGPAVNGSTITPITVIVANETHITADYLRSTIDTFLNIDDVLSKNFLQSIYLSSTEPGSTVLDESASRYIDELALDRFLLDSRIPSKAPASTESLKGVSEFVLPSGPYMALAVPGPTSSSISFFSTYRLYRDEHRDFITGIYPSNDGTGSFKPLRYMSSRWWDAMIPVPSRLHFLGDSRPLAGVRVAIKDLYDIHGLQTSGGSQAWIQITPIANSTAPAVQRLVDLGAQLVGKVINTVNPPPNPMAKKLLIT